MPGASKILTVSYGTFSCTLEGFNEPFNTMKAIAEYFRDLAADDRYFGAEPPTPDAAMLHRIAEREIQRRVEAKIQGNGVILRTGAALTDRASAPVPVLASVADAAPAVESAAVRLQRLRAAQAQIVTLPVAHPYRPQADLATQFVDEGDNQPVATVLPMPSAPPEPPMRKMAPEPNAAVVSVPDAEIMDATRNAPMAAPPAKTVPVTLAEPPQGPEAAVPEASFAPLPEPAALAEIAAEPAPLDTAPAPVDAVDTALRETLAGLLDQDDQLAAEPAPQPQPVPYGGYDDQLPESAAAYALDAGSEDVTVGAAAIDTAPAAKDIADLTALDGTRPVDGETTVTAPAEPEATPTPAAFPETEMAEPALPEPTLKAAPQPKGEPEVSVDANAPVVVVDEKVQRARARVIKIRRLDTVKPAPQVEAIEVFAPTAPALSPEDEADLQSILARLEAEIAPAPVAAAAAAKMPPAAVADPDPLTPESTPDAAAAETPAPDAPAMAPAAEPHKLPATAADDVSVSRLLAQTNSELEVPETRRRRSAIAHLKAAVLATVAERRINPNASKQELTVRMDPYRKDLDQVMRPAAPTALAAPDRPAPLMLVSAQRIDRKKDAPAGDTLRAVPQPVRPRRVTSGGLGIRVVSAQLAEDDEEDTLPAASDPDKIFAQTTSQSFEEFAESLNTTSLADLIEAAGAYCTVVLGRDSFTAPLLFQQITKLPDHAKLSREDGLRGFGRLLRDGRIQKTGAGRYALTETSPILSDARRNRS